MRAAVLAGAVGVAVMALAPASSVLAQQWIPPKPGQDTCSGWDTPEAQQSCRVREAEDQAKHDQAVRSREAPLRAAVDAEARRLKAEREAKAAAEARAAVQRAEAEREAIEGEELRRREAKARSDANTERDETLRREAKAQSDAEADEEKQLGGISARGFALRYRAFGAAVFSNPHFAGPPPLQSHDCEDAKPDRSYTCYYNVGNTVDVDAETEVGSDRLSRVELSWGGDDHRRDLFAQTAGYVVGALSPDAPAGTWRVISGRIYDDLPGAPFRFPPREWHVGDWHYRLWHDGSFGARNVVRFTAERDPS